MTPDEYFKKYADAAKATNEKYGIPISVVLAASALESGYNKSDLSSLFNNFFGIKPDQGYGTQYLATTEYVNGKYVPQMSSFAKFPNAEESFLGYGKFLTDNPRYEKAGVFAAGGDYRKVADALQAAGYATDPEYSTKLKKIIKDNNLAGYDLAYGVTPSSGEGLSNQQLKGFSDYLGAVQDGTDKEKYDIPKGRDGITVISPEERAANIAADAAALEKDFKLSWSQNIIKAVFVLLLIGVGAFILIQAFPLSPANIAGKVVKGVVKA